MIPHASASKIQSDRFIRHINEVERKNAVSEEESFLELEINLATMAGRHMLEHEFLCWNERQDVVMQLLAELTRNKYRFEAIEEGDKIKGVILKWD